MGCTSILGANAKATFKLLLVQLDEEGAKRLNAYLFFCKDINHQPLMQDPGTNRYYVRTYSTSDPQTKDTLHVGARISFRKDVFSADNVFNMQSAATLLSSMRGRRNPLPRRGGMPPKSLGSGPNWLRRRVRSRSRTRRPMLWPSCLRRHPPLSAV